MTNTCNLVLRTQNIQQTSRDIWSFRTFGIELEPTGHSQWKPAMQASDGCQFSVLLFYGQRPCSCLVSILRYSRLAQHWTVLGGPCRVKVAGVSSLFISVGCQRRPIVSADSDHLTLSGGPQEAESISTLAHQQTRLQQGHQCETSMGNNKNNKKNPSKKTQTTCQLTSCVFAELH